MVRHVLRGVLATEPARKANPVPSDWQARGRQIALADAREGLVLLKNAHRLLPLNAARLDRLAVIGPNARDFQWQGGGSAFIGNPTRKPDLVSALQEVARKAAPERKHPLEIRFVKGCSLSHGLAAPVPASALRLPDGSGKGLLGEYFNNQTLTGKPAFTRKDTQVNFDWGGGAPKGLPADHFSIRWTGKLIPPKTGTYKLGTLSDDGVRLWLDGKLIIDDWRDHAVETRVASVHLEAGRAYDLKLEYYELYGEAVARLAWTLPKQDQLDEARQAARWADVAIVCVGDNYRIESEGHDRTSLELPGDEVALVNAVAEANPRTVVVLNAGAPILMRDWLDRVPALLLCWFPGQEGDLATAEALFGLVNPSGKLPLTFPKRLADCRACANYPGSDGHVWYRERLFVGYRQYDADGLEPEFPFGFGLSYTTFKLSDLRLERTTLSPGGTLQVTVKVKNTGKRPGAEVVQLYVHKPYSRVIRPPKALKAFARLFLEPGETRTLSLAVPVAQLAFYNVRDHSWQVEPGPYEVLVGNSSRNLPLRGTFTVQ